MSKIADSGYYVFNDRLNECARVIPVGFSRINCVHQAGIRRVVARKLGWELLDCSTVLHTFPNPQGYLTLGSLRIPVRFARKVEVERSDRF